MSTDVLVSPDLTTYRHRLERISHEYFGRDAQMEAILKLGVETFGMDMGIVCRIAGQDSVVEWFYPPESGLRQGQIFQVKACFETPLFVGDELYGALNFSAQTAREQAFSDGDRTFLEDMAKAVSRLIKHK